MIFVYNGTDRKVQFEIEKIAGKPFKLIDRIRMGGNGSPQLFLTNLHETIAPYFKKSDDRKFINIELRENGILVYIKNESNDYICALSYADIELDDLGEFKLLKTDSFQFSILNNNTKRYIKFWDIFSAARSQKKV